MDVVIVTMPRMRMQLCVPVVYNTVSYPYSSIIISIIVIITNEEIVVTLSKKRSKGTFYVVKTVVQIHLSDDDIIVIIRVRAGKHRRQDQKSKLKVHKVVDF